ncbi:MAG: hypothetical protein HOP16_09775 [Acidobacteria bacterium]|nr:hypothetical protein [Acidobacteriota bacterium]
MTTVMGGETEYAISARDHAGQPIPQGPLLARFFAHTTAALKYSSMSSRGRFLRNGGLIYLDAGLHMEWATPEVTCPFEAVRYLEAGDLIVQDIATSFAAGSSDISEIFCSRTNVDYLSGTLWASHESYMHRANVKELPAQLLPFLASRVLFGAGGWDYRAPALRFTLSPRAHFISRTIDSDSQYTRPLFHTKDEPLSGPGIHRLHVACSERACSQTASVLRFGTTALVLALIERGARPGSDVALASPVWAVDRFAAAATGVSAPLLRGGRTTALAIQRHYLSRVEDAMDQLPFPWTSDVCALWRRTLDDIEEDRPRVAVTLDWAIKQRLFERRLAQRGIAWTSLRTWNTALDRIRRRWLKDAAQRPPFELATLLNPDGWLRTEMGKLSRLLGRQGLSWEQLPALAAARLELFELDAKFGALGENGIFNALDRAGALSHRVRDLDVADAVVTPPQDTRAKIRGDVVLRLSTEATSYGAEWTRVYDRARRRELDLMNPFETDERWREVSYLEDKHPLLRP